MATMLAAISNMTCASADGHKQFTFRVLLFLHLRHTPSTDKLPTMDSHIIMRYLSRSAYRKGTPIENRRFQVQVALSPKRMQLANKGRRYQRRWIKSPVTILPSLHRQNFTCNELSHFQISWYFTYY